MQEELPFPNLTGLWTAMDNQEPWEPIFPVIRDGVWYLLTCAPASAPPSPPCRCSGLCFLLALLHGLLPRLWGLVEWGLLSGGAFGISTGFQRAGVGGPGLGRRLAVSGSKLYPAGSG